MTIGGGAKDRRYYVCASNVGNIDGTGVGRLLPGSGLIVSVPWRAASFVNLVGQPPSGDALRQVLLVAGNRIGRVGVI